MHPDAKITEHFKWGEAIGSETAEREGLDNTPDQAAIKAIHETAQMMESIRSLLVVPLKVTSWFRAPAVNAAVGGAPTSDHVTGRAVDFRPRGMDARDAAERIADSPIMFDQLIWYPGQDRLHIGFGGKDRREVMTKRLGVPGYVEGLRDD